MKIPIILITFATMCSVSVAQEAQRSSLTPDQIAKHLGLSGGNWSVSFAEALYCGFILSETTEDGEIVKKYHWSSDASRVHQFHFMHHINRKDQDGTTHEVEFSSYQEGEWEKNGASKTRSGGGSGMTYVTELPSGIQSETRIQSNLLRVRPESAELLFGWSSEKTKRAFKLEVIFSRDKAEAEQVGTGQPATRPQSKSEGSDKSKPEAEGRSR